jgi:hypothetical protein
MKILKNYVDRIIKRYYIYSMEISGLPIKSVRRNKMKIIGSRMAEKMAKGKFGKLAYVSRDGGLFYVGVLVLKMGSYYLKHVWGVGKSWEKALANAGVVVPEITEDQKDLTPPTKSPFMGVDMAVPGTDRSGFVTVEEPPYPDIEHGRPCDENGALDLEEQDAEQ